MNNNFYNPGNLDNDAFKPAGDLNSSTSFKPAGDLNSGASFKPAEDLENKGSNNFKFIQPETMTVDEIKKYIASVQTGTRSKETTSGGRVIVNFEYFKDIVNKGYNIISANYMEQIGMVEVEFDAPIKYITR